jgi:hypothetical protein
LGVWLVSKDFQGCLSRVTQQDHRQVGHDGDILLEPPRHRLRRLDRDMAVVGIKFRPVNL